MCSNKSWVRAVLFRLRRNDATVMHLGKGFDPEQDSGTFISSKGKYCYLCMSGYWVLVLDVNSREVSLFGCINDTGKVLERRIFDGYKDGDIIYVSKSHTVEYIAVSTSNAVDEVVHTLDCVDVVDFNYTSRWRKFIPHNQSSIQFVRSNSTVNLDLVPTLYAILASRAILAFVQHCSVNVVYIIGAPCPSYRSLSSRCKVCWLYNYDWDEDLLDGCSIYDNIDDVENTSRCNSTNVCSYDSRYPLGIPERSMCYMVDSQDLCVNLVCDRAVVISRDTSLSSTITPTTREFKYNTRCITDNTSTIRSIMSCFNQIPSYDLFATTSETLGTYVYSEFNGVDMY